MLNQQLAPGRVKVEVLKLPLKSLPMNFEKFTLVAALRFSHSIVWSGCQVLFAIRNWVRLVSVLSEQSSALNPSVWPPRNLNSTVLPDAELRLANLMAQA